MNKYAYLLLIAFSLTVISWGVMGHRTVANIAENHLGIQARSIVKELLGTQTMADVSTWADEVRSQPDYKHTAGWHFLNLPLGLTHDAFRQAVTSQDKENVYTAILAQERILKDDNSTKEQLTEALKYLIHFVGDAHQPMHISRAEDKGGNTIQLRFEGKGTNLHSLWDGRLLDKQGLSETELLKKYDNKISYSQIEKLQADDVLQWLWESYEISSKLYVEIEQDNKLGDDYYNAHLPIVQDRITKAGIRLAGVLDECFANSRLRRLADVPKPPKPVEEGTPYVPEITVNDVTKYIGMKACVTGKVYSHKDMKSFVLLNIGADYPNEILTVVLRGQAKAFADELQDRTSIRVTGKLVEYKGKPQIEVTDPKQILHLTVVE